MCAVRNGMQGKVNALKEACLNIVLLESAYLYDLPKSPFSVRWIVRIIGDGLICSHERRKNKAIRKIFLQIFATEREKVQ